MINIENIKENSLNTPIHDFLTTTGLEAMVTLNSEPKASVSYIECALVQIVYIVLDPAVLEWVPRIHSIQEDADGGKGFRRGEGRVVGGEDDLKEEKRRGRKKLINERKKQ